MTEVQTRTEIVSFSNETPSGIEVYYQPEQEVLGKKVPRLYRVRRNEHMPWVEVPSVTNALDVIDKPGLKWWGQGIGIEGVTQLIHMGLVVPMHHNEQWVLCIKNEAEEFVVASTDEIVALMTAQKITVNHQRDKAAVRGTAVHDAFELWSTSGVIPAVEMYPPEEQGYVQGLLQFLEEVNPSVFNAEVMVGSIEHRFAGRFDVTLEIAAHTRVVFHRTPARGPQYAILTPGRYLCDLKTSKHVYWSHMLQLEGYELASVECGYEPTVGRLVLHVDDKGHYKVVESLATSDDYLHALNLWRAMKRIG